MRCDILPRTYRMVRYRLWQNFPMRLNTAACGKLIPRQHAMRWKMLPVSWGSPTKCQDHHKPPRAVLEDRNSFESSCMMKCWRELVFFSEFLAVRCIRCHGVSFLLDMFCFSATHCEGYREKRTASIFLLHFVHHHSSQSIQYSVLLLCVLVFSPSCISARTPRSAENCTRTAKGNVLLCSQVFTASFCLSFLIKTLPKTFTLWDW